MTESERRRFEQSPTNTVIATANYLGVGRDQAYAAIKAGTIPSLRIATRILVPTKKLLALLEPED